MKEGERGREITLRAGCGKSMWQDLKMGMKKERIRTWRWRWRWR